jgi:Protein of unknown function (DUF4012)
VRVRRILRWVGVGAALLFAVLLAGVSISALSVRRHLANGQAALEQGRSDLVGGDAAGADDAFSRARTSFGEASDGASGAWFWMLGQIPFAGRNADAVVAIASSGEDVAEAGTMIAGAVDGLPEGLASLAPVDGRVPIERFDGITEAVAAATVQTADALRSLESAPHGLLLGPIGSAREEAEDRVRSAYASLSTGSDVLDGLPSLLGADGPRRYFFGAQNPAELRGTGGVIGAYSILTVDRGRFDFSPFAPIQSLPKLDPQVVPPPSPDYAENYNALRGDGRFWLAINLTPDFPTAARALLDGYRVAEGERLDGAILADPFALRALLQAAGPAEVPGLGRTVGQDEVVPFTSNEAYSLYPDPTTRKQVLGSVASAVFSRFLGQDDTDERDLRVLVESASQGHLLLFSDDPEIEEGLQGTGAGGAFHADRADDLLSVVENSSGGTKVDYYEDREVRYDVQLFAGGFAKATTDLWLTNHAPTEGEPRYVIGPNPGFARRGEGGQLVSVYCGHACTLEEAVRDGEGIGVWQGSEDGNTFFQDYFRTASGDTSHLTLRWSALKAWQGDDTGGTYRLTFLNQTTIRPTTLKIDIRPPAGMGITDTSPGMDVSDGVATWRGEPTERLELFVHFEPPLLTRMWRSFVG